MPIFVVHEHNATHLHWDLRLQIGSVLKSWALPKQPPRTTGIKRLAIEVEDHLLSYAVFEGEIKEGYGKGTVKIWDRGKYELIYRDNEKIEVIFQGIILKGKYILIKTNFGEENPKQKSWLFFKI